MKPVIELKNLGFSYKNSPLFNDFNFEIQGNQFAGIIGVNGSGKSTLLKLIMGLLSPQSGQIEVLGHSAGSFATKSLIGASLQDIDFPGTEKVHEILQFVSSQFKKPLNIEDLINDFALNDFRNKACGQLSGGMKRRLSLACAFMGRPQVVLLDEPTTGLDFSSRFLLMENLKKYQSQHQALILMISHHPEEVLSQVDQFFHVKSGALSSLSPEKMKELTQIKKISFTAAPGVSLPNHLQAEFEDNCYNILVNDSDQFVRDLVRQTVKFQNLQVQGLGAQELMEKVL